MKLRLSTPAALVDIGRIAELDGHRARRRRRPDRRDGDPRRGRRVRARPARRARCSPRRPAIIGDRQVRNRGTIGGSLAHADPGADYPTVVTALGATITRRGRERPARDRGRRLLHRPVHDGARARRAASPRCTCRRRRRDGSAYVKHKHPASGYAVVGVAAAVGRSRAAAARARGSSSAASTGAPVDATAAAESLVGSPGLGGRDRGGRGRRCPTRSTDVIGDTYASAEYRTHLATVLARRALTTAFRRAA